MKNILMMSLIIILGSMASAQDAVVSVQIVSKDKVISSVVVDVGPCYVDQDTSNHDADYTISFPLTTRESGQTWLESRGEVVSGSLATFDRLVTKDYTRRISPTNFTNHSQRSALCGQIRASYVTNMELAKQFFKSATPSLDSK